MIKLSLTERLLVESLFSHYYYVTGPGIIWLKPWERGRLKFDIGPQEQSLTIEQVRTVENIPVDITTELLYQVDPTFLTLDLLPKLPGLYHQGWQKMLKWRTEYSLHQLVAGHSWKALSQEAVRACLERQLTERLAASLELAGLQVTAACLVKVELPDNLQYTIIQAEKAAFAALYAARNGCRR
jgi:hypothetical protein